MATKYAFDCSKLVKGSAIDEQTIAQVTGTTPGTEAFGFELRKLQTFIEEEMKRLGIVISACRVGHEIHILSDHDAVDYNEKTFHHARRRMHRSSVRQTNVDKNNLCVHQSEKHDRLMGEHGSVMRAIRSAENRREWLKVPKGALTVQPCADRVSVAEAAAKRRSALVHYAPPQSIS